MNQIITHFKRYCPACGKNKIIADEFSGESFCRQCGFVISEKNVDENAEWRTFTGDEKNRSRVGDRTSILIHDMGLSTVIGESNQDGIGRKLSHPMKESFRRLREYDRRIRLSGTSQKNLVNALSEMNNIKIKLSLTEPVVEFAAYIFRKASERRLTRGRTIKAMVGACVYLACRNGNIARSMADIARVLNIGKRNLSSCYRLLLIQFDIKVPPPNPLTADPELPILLDTVKKQKDWQLQCWKKRRPWEDLQEGSQTDWLLLHFTSLAHPMEKKFPSRLLHKQAEQQGLQSETESRG